MPELARPERWTTAATRVGVTVVVTLVALALIAAGAWISGSRPESGTADSATIPDPRRRTSAFLSNVIVLASAVFFMAVLLQGVAALILGSCER